MSNKPDKPWVGYVRYLRGAWERCGIVYAPTEAKAAHAAYKQWCIRPGMEARAEEVELPSLPEAVARWGAVARALLQWTLPEDEDLRGSLLLFLSGEEDFGPGDIEQELDADFDEAFPDLDPAETDKFADWLKERERGTAR